MTKEQFDSLYDAYITHGTKLFGYYPNDVEEIKKKEWQRAKDKTVKQTVAKLNFGLQGAVAFYNRASTNKTIYKEFKYYAKSN